MEFLISLKQKPDIVQEDDQNEGKAEKNWRIGVIVSLVKDHTIDRIKTGKLYQQLNQDVLNLINIKVMNFFMHEMEIEFMSETYFDVIKKRFIDEFLKILQEIEKEKTIEDKIKE